MPSEKPHLLLRNARWEIAGFTKERVYCTLRHLMETKCWPRKVMESANWELNPSV